MNLLSQIKNYIKRRYDRLMFRFHHYLAICQKCNNGAMVVYYKDVDMWLCDPCALEMAKEKYKVGI